MRDTKDILRKYSGKIEKQLNNQGQSREYTSFKKEMIPELSKYEKFCKTLGNFIKLKVAEKDKKKIQRYIDIAHLEVAPEQCITLSIMSFLSVFLIGILISVAVTLIKGSFASFPILFLFLVIFVSFFLFKITSNYPKRLANKWRLKASSQMVPAILYIIVYMRHTPNLEKAISFASEHLEKPLALDFKKVFYDVQIGKFSTIKESLDNYLETWRDYSSEFIESFHLIESSLFEPDNTRRIQILEKALQVVLEGVYNKMLKFTHDVGSPLKIIYMLGVMLPILMLTLLPLASVMLGGLLKWYHIVLLFNLLIPFMVFYMTEKILYLRPGGHGQTRLLEKNPLYYKYKDKKPYLKAFLICLPFLILGFLPLIFQYTPLPELIGMQKDYTFAQIGLGSEDLIFNFVQKGQGYVGPFGIGALILSMFIPLGIGLFFALSFSARTKELIIEREKTNELEKEFNNSLFQIGNRLGNGMPAELVFAKVAESSKGLKTEDFFKRVNYNIQQMGMSVEDSIFDSRRGAIKYYPSSLISTSMKILVESVKKGLNIAAISLMSISQYIKNIQKITNRLRDLLAEIISDMKSNITFLTPLLLGIVVGLSAMITSILSKLLNLSEFTQSSGEVANLGNIDTLLGIFQVQNLIPPYYLQIAIGIYIIEIIFILTGTLVTINSGEDKLEQTNKTGKNLFRGLILYFIVATIATVALFVLGTIVLGNIF